MFYLIPAPAHRAALRIAHMVRLRWWTLRRPDIAGCRVLALDDSDRVLLVRHSYGTGKWMPPGGGMKRGEDPLAAASRELLEEAGCRLEMPLFQACAEEDFKGARNFVNIVSGRTRDHARPDGREIIAAQFFAADALPENLPGLFRERLGGWVKAAIIAHRRDAAGYPDLPAPTE